ncbi:MAG TPA: DUF502 domain-containing protein [Vicinamibacterales bacterium]|nr:DUF502 domain-containing protein [Vicinamibacterales bacterium]
MQWLRRSFITGFFVMVPLIVSVAALVWAFRVVDDFATPLATRIVGRVVPGIGVLIMATLVLGVGAGATNVIGKRVLQQAEDWLLRVPVFKTVYAPVRQLVAAFSPDNDAGFKRVVLVDEPGGGMLLGFLTREFMLDRGAGAEAFVAVYVPTNHLYLGDVLAFPRSRVHYPELAVEDGVRIFLTGGMALPRGVRSRAEAGPV